MSVLGFHKDSILNLSSLAHHDSEDFGETSDDEGAVGLGMDDDSENDAYLPLNKVKVAEDSANEFVIGIDLDDVNLDDGRSLSASSSSASFDSVGDGGDGAFGENDDKRDEDVYDFGLDPYAWNNNSALIYPGTTAKKKGDGGLLACIFPFFFSARRPLDDYMSDDEEEEPLTSSNPPAAAADTSQMVTPKQTIVNQAPRDDDTEGKSSADSVNSQGSSHYGTPLTGSEHLAVLARLKLQEKRTTAAAAKSKQKQAKQGSLPDGEKDAGPAQPKKGILKYVRTDSLSSRKSLQKTEAETQNRRSLFPAAATAASTQPQQHHAQKTTSFAPMAKVIVIPPLSGMSYFTKCLVWWQKSDYDDFKKTARIITRAMLTGGSEIWLHTTNSFGDVKNIKTKHEQEADVDLDDEATEENQKWWCKFGHSRRGLEHITCIEEGKQRQQSVNKAITSVVSEYRRQKIRGHLDPQALARHSLQYTSWARDLALASGLADADAVQTNFDEKTKKNRNDFLDTGNSSSVATLIQASHNKMLSSPSSSTKDILLRPDVLDAYTRTNTMMLKQIQQESEHSHRKQQQQHHNHHHEKDLSRKAAGFGSGLGMVVSNTAGNGFGTMTTGKNVGIVA